MRAVVQRVTEASVTVDGHRVAAIGRGMLVLLGVRDGDTTADSRALASKLATLRIFADASGRMNRDVGEAGGEVLVVSQFTLLGDTRKGRRPSFTAAARPPVAAPLIDQFLSQLVEQGIPTASGRFGERMQVGLINDGPVTVIIETRGGRVV